MKLGIKGKNGDTVAIVEATEFHVKCKGKTYRLAHHAPHDVPWADHSVVTDIKSGLRVTAVTYGERMNAPNDPTLAAKRAVGRLIGRIGEDKFCAALERGHVWEPQS